MNLPTRNQHEEQCRLYRIFSDQMTPGLICLDPLMKIIQVNSALCLMLEFKEKELIGRSYLDIVDKTQVSQVLEKFWRQLHGERSIYETSLITRGGQCLPVMVSAAPYMDDSGQIQGVFGFYTDLTTQKKAEQEMRFQANMLTNIRDCLIAVDLQGQIIYWNKGAEKIFGWGQEEFVGSKLEDLLIPEEIKRWAEILNEVGEGKTWRGQMEMLNRSQISRTVQFSWAPFWDENHQINGAIGLAVDISELIEARCRAEAAYRVKSELLSNMSHEIRTPLAGILGFTDLLIRENLSPRLIEFVTNIQRCGQQLGILINNILELSKMEAERISLQSTEFEITNLVQDCAATIQSQVEEANLELEILISPQVPRVLKGDAGRISQVLTNLLGNAVKFTRQGKIAIRVNRSENKPFSSALFPLQITVSDTGIGIPRTAQKSIFEAFTQVNGTKPLRQVGTGLGLNISRRLVEFMGGQIWVDSEEGKGSTFYFWVPLEMPTLTPVKSESDQLTPADFPSRADRMFGSILVVEDNDANRRLLTYMLTDEGYTVRTAKNGYECLELLDSEKFEVVLMDMQMPILDGYATTRRIRQTEKWRDLPVIALTAHAMKGDAEKCLEAGCNTYLAKPFNRDQLLNQIQRLLYTKQQQKEASARDKQERLLRKLLPEFLDSLDQILVQMGQALAEENPTQLLELSHDLKGSAGLYGLGAISELGAQIYRALKERETINLVQLYEQLKSEAQKARQEIENRE